MPKINKIRVSNVKMDGKSKQIGDQTWELNGKNTLFLLENGGGKTSLIQLVAQVVLPNSEIQGRKMSQNVDRGETRHIAIEWTPDDSNYPNFITGFCFQNHGVKISNSENAATYEYFNYIIENEDLDSLEIEKLPFVEGASVATHAKLKSFLTKQVGVYLFKTNTGYQESLEQYGLLASEWLNILKVNGDEGGIGGFFEKADKTITLLERLLIPSLMENLYPGNKEKDEIINAFKSYKINLLKLPELEKDLEDFQVINKHSDSIIEACQVYGQAKSDLTIARERLTRLYHSLKKEEAVNASTIESIELELSDLSEQLEIINYKIASYEVHLKKMALENDEKKFNERSEDVDELESHKNFLINKIEEQMAARSYEEYKKEENTKNELTSKIIISKLNTTEKSEELNKMKKVVSEQYNYLISELKKEKQLNIEGEKECKRTLLEIDNNLRENNNNREEINKQVTSLETILEQYERNLIIIKKELSKDWDKSVDNSLIGLKKIDMELRKEHTEKAEKVEIMSNNITDFQFKLNKNESENDSLNKDIEQNTREFEEFAESENKLRSKIQTNAHYSVNGNLFNDRENISYRLDKQSNSLENESTRVSILINHSEEILNNINERGYHAPIEIESVKTFLVNKGVDVLLGVDWLKRSTESEETKKELMEKNPLIPFSIIIEEKQIARSKNLLQQYKKDLSIPIFFVDKNRMAQADVKSNFFEMQSDTYMFHKFTKRFTESDWELYVSELTEGLSRLVDDKRKIGQKIKEINTLNFEVKQFWEKYEEFSRESFKEKIEALKKTVIELEKQRQFLVDSMGKEIENQKKLVDEINSLNDQLEALGKKLHALERFISQYESIEEDRGKLNCLIVKKKNVENSIVVENSKKIEEEILLEEYRHEETSIQTKLTELRRDFVEYGYSVAAIGSSVELSKYEETKSYFKELKSKADSNQNEIEYFEKMLLENNNRIGNLEESISSNGFSLNTFGNLSIEYNKRILEQFELDFGEVKDELHQQEQKLSELRGGISNQRKTVTREREKIYQEYGVELYEYDEGEEEYAFFVSESREIKSSLKKLNETLGADKTRENELSSAIKSIKRSEEYFINVGSLMPYEDDEWDKERPLQFVDQIKSEILNSRDKIRDSERKIDDRITELDIGIGMSENKKLLRVQSELKSSIKNTKDDYNEMIEIFKNIKVGLKHKADQLTIQKSTSENERDELVKLMFKRSEKIHNVVVDMDKSSQISENGQSIKLFTIKWPKNEIEDAIYQFKNFVDSILDELVKMQDKGSTENELDKFFENKATIFNIINCYADTNKCLVKCLKPKNKFLSKQKVYGNWDEVTKWSGGERHTARASMFIGLNDYLRKMRFASNSSYKFVLLDNPFGAASSEHVVGPMIELARVTKTQLFCLTAIQERDIINEFDTVISNQYVPQRGRLLLSSETSYKSEKSLDLETLSYSS